MQDQCVPALEAAPAPFSPLPAAPRLDTAQPPVDFTLEDAERARFSGGRFVVEMFVSGVGGAAAGYATYKAMCDREPCVGGFLGAAAVETVGTPLLAYGIGQMMGGRGSLMTTYFVGLLGFTATGPLVDKNPALALTISFGLLPILSPLGYEVSSGTRSQAMRKALGVARVSPVVVPILHGSGVVGGALGLAGTL